MSSLIATNTLSNEHASGRDAAGTRDAGGHGRPSFSPETTRKHIGLYEMATKEMVVPREVRDVNCGGLPHSLAIVVARSIAVWARVQVNGPDGLKCVRDARDLRMLLGLLNGRFQALHMDSRTCETGFSLMDIAEIRVGIRDRNGSMKQEWM